MRNRASPDIMRRSASSAFSKGSVSIMGRTSVRTLKSRVSCVSIALPVRLPMTERPPKMSGTPLTGSDHPKHQLPQAFREPRRPGSRLAIAAPLGAVARITSARRMCALRQHGEKISRRCPHFGERMGRHPTRKPPAANRRCGIN